MASQRSNSSSVSESIIKEYYRKCSPKLLFYKDFVSNVNCAEI